MFQITSNALTTFQQARTTHGLRASVGVRIFLERDTGGLVGMVLAFAEQPQNGDYVIDIDGNQIFVVPELADSLVDSVLDVSPADHGAGFVIVAQAGADVTSPEQALISPSTRPRRAARWRGPRARLMRRIAALEDERDVQKTMFRYAHSIDYGLEEEWLDCFTPDGVLHIRRPAPLATRHAGRAQLAEFAASHTRAPAHIHKHVLVESRIVLDGDHATSSSYFFRFDLLAAGPVVRSFGRYHDRMVRCDDSVWRLEERVVDHETSRPAPIRAAWN